MRAARCPIVGVSRVRRGVVLLGMILLLALARGPDRAAAVDGVELALEVPPTIQVGDDIPIMVRLTASGAPLSGQIVELRIDDQIAMRAVTGPDGAAGFQVRGTLAAGDYAFVANFPGTDTLATATTAATVTVEPAMLEIRTVPSLPGVTFTLDGHPFAADAEGIARFPISQPGTFRLEAPPRADLSTTQRADFSRWSDDVYVGFRDITIPGQRRLVAGFLVSYLTNLTFADAEGEFVPPTRISSIRVRTAQGQTLDLDPQVAQWLPATTVVKTPAGLRAQPVRYSVQEVIVDGIRTVRRGEVTFTLRPEVAPSIPLSLHRITVAGRATLLGDRVGTGVVLQHPDGTREYRPYDETGAATFDGLPIGTYRAWILGAGGYARAQLFDLVPGATITIPVITYFLMGLVLAIPVGLLFALLVVSGTRVGRFLPAGVGQPVGIARRFMYGVAGVAAVVGVIGLGYGLTAVHGSWLLTPDRLLQPAETLAATWDAEPEPTATAVVPASETRPAVEVAEVFRRLWNASGGPRVFGRPVGAAYQQVDAETGVTLTIQYFDRARFELHPHLAGTRYEIQLGRVGWEEAARRGLLGTEPFQPVPAATAEQSANCDYFPTTGHRVCGHFRTFWRNNGLRLGDSGISFRESLALFGYPISEEFPDPDTGLIVQYFERARLEYRPEQAGTPGEVTLGELEGIDP